MDINSGTILPDSIQTIEIIINTTGLAGGDYSNDILIESNDPDEGLLIFPVTLSINSLDGDANGDGMLNILDLVIIANMVLANDYNTIADMNDDGFLNILDLVLLVNIILEI